MLAQKMTSIRLESVMPKVNAHPVRNSALERILLIMDLDSTLIYASETEIHKPYDYKVFQFFIYLRPYFLRFLKSVSGCFSLAVWSAGSDKYVQNIVEKVFPPDISFDFVWARSRCSFEGYSADIVNENDLYSKNLNILKRFGYKMDKVLLMDDSPGICLMNRKNSIHIQPFLGSAADSELLHLDEYLLKIYHEKNVMELDLINWYKSGNV